MHCKKPKEVKKKEGKNIDYLKNNNSNNKSKNKTICKCTREASIRKKKVLEMLIRDCVV